MNIINRIPRINIKIDIINGLVNRWPLTSNANDITSGLNMTNNNGVTFSSSGANFNGTNQYLLYSTHLMAFYPITFMAWHKPLSWSQLINICGDENNTSGGMRTALMQFGDSTIQLFCSGKYYNLINHYNEINYPSTIFTLSTITFDGTTIKFYKNDNLVIRTSSLSTYSSTLYGTMFAIERLGNYNGHYYKGKIQDVRIYNRVLLDSEISALYYRGPN